MGRSMALVARRCVHGAARGRSRSGPRSGASRAASAGGPRAAHVHRGEGLLQAFGDDAVEAARLGGAGGVVVGEDDGGGVVYKGAAHDLARATLAPSTVPRKRGSKAMTRWRASRKKAAKTSARKPRRRVRAWTRSRPSRGRRVSRSASPGSSQSPRRPPAAMSPRASRRTPSRARSSWEASAAGPARAMRSRRSASVDSGADAAPYTAGSSKRTGRGEGCRRQAGHGGLSLCERHEGRPPAGRAAVWNDGNRPAAQLRESNPIPLTRRRSAARRDWNRIRCALPYRRNETDLNEGAPRSIGDRPRQASVPMHMDAHPERWKIRPDSEAGPCRGHRGDRRGLRPCGPKSVTVIW